MSDLNEFVQCSICLENYDLNIRAPRMLICQHSLCSKCLKDIFEMNKAVECPICRHKITNSLDEVPKNRYIIQYIESLAQQKNTNVHNNELNTSVTPTSRKNDQWDERQYFKEIFDDIDHNNDGEINGQELHEALQKGQPNSTFDPKTVYFLLKKFDQNNDDEISFEEFYNLFIGINNQYNDFLDIDVDFSGTIDSVELATVLRKKNCNFSQNFFNYFIEELAKRTGKNSISFDMYVRVIARIDYLRQQFNQERNKNAQNGDQSKNIEYYIANQFFSNF